MQMPLVLGMFTLIMAILIGRYGPSSGLFHWVEGVLYGLSVVLNLTFLIRVHRKGRGASGVDDLPGSGAE